MPITRNIGAKNTTNFTNENSYKLRHRKQNKSKRMVIINIKKQETIVKTRITVNDNRKMKTNY